MSSHLQVSDAPSSPCVSTEHAPPLRSIHTTTFPLVLDDLAASLMVTTYQAGKLIILRNNRGLLNTHFRDFRRPMGLALAGGRLAIGTSSEVWEFHDVPAVCAKLNSLDLDGKEGSADRSQLCLHDACFLPRQCHITGDVQVHEMAWAGDELWFVNTTFSCLATRSLTNSFEPCWRPPFITDLRPADSCHLNGMANRDGRVRHVTALGETSDAEGWRRDKRQGGVLIDVDSGETIVRGLSMPHSPRWYRNKLWLLESGRGGFGVIDLAAEKYQEIVQLPGFTRGLAFAGSLAFIGLSQVRESATFSDIPLVDRLNERTCGVWIVDLESGRTVAFVKFEGSVQEIFAVECLHGRRFPDVINNDPELIGSTYVLGEAAMADVPPGVKSLRPSSRGERADSH
jgi:uncharacterized protein (TIGR03032 family)